ncbi:hypothetical protein ACI2LF_02695 [Kribbella sp. NPDC020789]
MTHPPSTVTTPVRTVLDCIRILPLREGLAIADSALRKGMDHDELLQTAARLRGPHRRRIRQTAALADGRAESVLESALRALLIEAGIDGFVPQVLFTAAGSRRGSTWATPACDSDSRPTGSSTTGAVRRSSGTAAGTST